VRAAPKRVFSLFDSPEQLDVSRPTIAIVGASNNRRKFGNKAVRAYASRGYEVYPVHPSATEIEGHIAYPNVAAVPVSQLDRISIYLPSDTCLQLLPQLAKKPAGEIWFNPGADHPAVLAEARALGLPVVVGCSIVDVGVNPHSL
jgi:predicted CoA-binding protein